MTQTKKDGGLRHAATLRSISRPSMLLTSVVVALVIGAASRPAQAKLLEVYADAYVGGMYGTEPKFNSVVTQKPDLSRGDDFYNDNSGALLGARAGIEVLYTDIYVQFDQLINLRGFSGSTLQGMIGWDFGLGDGNWRGTLGAYGGVVFGFPYAPHFPIDSSQIATIGVAAEGQAGVERVLNRLLRLQLIATVGYHYMFGGSESVTIDAIGNTSHTTTHGFHLLLKAGIRFNLGI